jgi:nucleotide-binding universal stress UspA family protein
MKYFRVLVPLDGSDLSEQAIPYAQAVAASGGVLIYAQAVPGAEPLYGLIGNKLASEGEVAGMYAQSAKEELERVKARWAAVAPNVEIDVAAGDPTETILALAERNKADMIVMASAGRGALGRWTFGSVADRIAHVCPIPVMIVRGRDAGVEPGVAHIARVIVPYDGSELAEESFDEAAHLAAHIDREVLLVRAIFPESEVAPTRGFEAVYTPDLYQTMTESLEADARKSLDEAAAKITAMGARVATEIRHGPTAQSIAESARFDDVIVITSHGRTGVKRWLMGSVAEKLVRTGPCPVIVVRSGHKFAAE